MERKSRDERPATGPRFQHGHKCADCHLLNPLIRPTVRLSSESDLRTHTKGHAPPNRYSTEALYLDPNPMIRSARPRTADCDSTSARANRNSCKTNAGIPGFPTYPQNVRSVLLPASTSPNPLEKRCWRHE